MDEIAPRQARDDMPMAAWDDLTNGRELLCILFRENRGVCPRDFPIQPNPFGNTEKVLRDWCVHKSAQIFTD